MVYKKHLIIILFCAINTLTAQTLIFGNILNTNNEPIVNANILAIPKDTDEKMMFTTSDSNGYYQIYLTNNKAYKFTFSHISYINFNKQFLVTKKEEFNAILQDNVNELEEILITEQAPISIKKDTTTYKVSAFTNGKERKLRETLKKLPGLEVDKNGGVTINGKKITRLLVEGKVFFYGDTKLGVNNIPADVVDKIEIIEDFHDTVFLKGIESSEDIAMNVKLKADKKKFAFGEVESGLGIKNRYKLHPKIFKYTPKLSLNIIGDLNNTFKKSFTIRDYINFEGGFNLENSSEIFKSNIVDLLRTNDYINNKHKFLGLNFQLNTNDHNEFRFFVIGLNDSSDYMSLNRLIYINDDLDETRTRKEENNTKLILSKLIYNYEPSESSILRSEITFEKNNIGIFKKNTSDFFENNLGFNQKTKNVINKLKAKVNLDKKINKNHVLAFKAKMNFNYSLINANSISNDNVFSNEIPIVIDENYSIIQNQKNKAFNIEAFGKYYWVINRKNHLYFSATNRFTNNHFFSDDFQNLSNNEVNNFLGFNNNLISKYNYFNSEVDYKRIFSDITAEFKLRFENHNLENLQQETKKIISKSNLVPEFKLKWDINSKKELEFTYATNYNYAPLNNYATGNVVQGFYSIFKGNDKLNQIKKQNFRLKYSYRKTYGLSIYSSLSFNKNSDIILNAYQLLNIYTSITPTQLSIDNKTYNTRIKFSYNKPYWNLKYGFRYIWSNSNNLIDNNLLSTKFNTISNSIDFSTKFEENPNVEINANYTISDNKTKYLINKQQRFSVITSLNYDFKDWKLETNYTFTNFKNKTRFKTQYFFDDLSLSLFYNKEDSLWSFESKIYNLTNNKSHSLTELGSTVINQEQIIVFPRYVMLSITYKL